MNNEFKNRRVKRARSREEREKRNAYERARRGREGHRARQLKSRYGLSENDFDELVRQQGGKCACCKERLPVDVDHSHETGVVRGILCRACNVGIGLLGDSIEGVLRAIQYLQRPVQ